MRILDEQTCTINETKSFSENTGDNLKNIMNAECLLENIYDNNVFAFGDITYLLKDNCQNIIHQLDTINLEKRTSSLIGNEHESQIYYYIPKLCFNTAMVNNSIKLKLSGSSYFFFGFIDSKLLNTEPKYTTNYFIIDSEKGDYVKVKNINAIVPAPDLKVSQNEVKLSGSVNFTIKFYIN